MKIGEDPENQKDVIDYFKNAERKLTFESPTNYPTTKTERISSELKIAIDFTSDVEKKYEEDGGKYYVFCLNLSDQNPFNMKQQKFYKKEVKRLFYPNFFGRLFEPEMNKINTEELYEIKKDQIIEMLKNNVLKKKDELKEYKNYTTQTTNVDNRIILFPYVSSSRHNIPSTIINKFGENLRINNPEKWEEWKIKYENFKRGKPFWKPGKYFEVSGAVHRNTDRTVKNNEYDGGGFFKNLYIADKYKRWNGDPFYVYDQRHDMYRVRVDVKDYKTEEEINVMKNPKSSIHALIILKICINQDIELDKYPEETIPRPTATVSILMQYERIIVNNKLYSETYMDKKIVETLCDDEPVEPDETEPLNLSDNNLKMFNSDSTNSSGYEYATPGGGRKKTRRKKQKKNNTKRDKTKKKNKKRTRKMKR
jgi:hypothetical protein